MMDLLGYADRITTVGSGGWTVAIGWSDGDGDLAQLSTNVLRTFLER